MKAVSQKEIQLDPGFWTKTSQIQLFYGLWVNMCHLGIGMAFGFASVQLPQLSAEDSFIPVTRNEASWIASVFSLFSPIGCLVSGYVTDWLGRRIMIIVCQAPICVGWLCTGFAKSPRQVIIGRALTGIGSGMAMTPPRIYGTEIALPNMRGVIGSFSTLAISTGVSIQAGLGQFLSWPVLCYICSIYTLANFICFFFLPETPYFMLKSKSVDEARVALTHFRARNYDFDKEMEQLIEYKEAMDIRKISAREHLALLFTRSSCIPFTIIVIYLFFTQMTGTTSVMIWAVAMLTVTDSSVDVNTGNFLMSVTRLGFITLTSILLFKVGRKPLALISAVGVAVICVAISIHTSNHNEPSLAPLIFFMGYMAFASFGYYTIPFLMAAEMFPLQNRGILGGITTTIASLLIFCSLQLTPYLLDNIGLSKLMMIYGISSLMSLIFVYLFLPETKDLTLQEIEEYYSQLRPTLVSHRQHASRHIAQNSDKLKNESEIPKAGTSSDASGLVSTIVKVDKENKVQISRSESGSAPRASVDSVVLRKVMSLAKLLRKKRSGENSKQFKSEEKSLKRLVVKNKNLKSNKTPLDDVVLEKEKSKPKDIPEDVESPAKIDALETPGTSKELQRKSRKTTFAEKVQGEPLEIEREEIKKQSNESITSRGSKKSNPNEKTSERKKDSE